MPRPAPVTMATLPSSEPMDPPHCGACERSDGNGPQHGTRRYPRAMPDAVIVSAVRTPIATAYRGALANVAITELGKVVVAEALKRSGVAAEDVDDLVLGELMQG